MILALHQTERKKKSDKYIAGVANLDLAKTSQILKQNYKVNFKIMANQQTSLDFSIESILGPDTPPEEEVEKNIKEVPTETLDFSIESILGPDALTPKVSEPSFYACSSRNCC